MNSQLRPGDVPGEYPDGTWLHLPDLHGTGYTDVIYRDDAEGHNDHPKPDRHWWSFRYRAWITWLDATRRGAAHRDAMVLEPAAPGAGQRIANQIRTLRNYHTPCSVGCLDCERNHMVEKAAEIAAAYPWGGAPRVAECTEDTSHLVPTVEWVPVDERKMFISSEWVREPAGQDDAAWDAIKVYCPGRTCNAAPGEACRTSEGRVRRELHLLRRLATLDGPLHRCPHGPCPDCWHTGWIEQEVPSDAAGPA